MSERYTYFMPGRLFLAAALLAVSLSGQAQPAPFDKNYEPPRTPNGDPDLQGIWSNAVITPLERPKELADMAFLPEGDVKEYVRKRLAATNRDNRSEDASVDTFNAYNDFWWDSGDNVVRTHRTSLIIDPENGRLPPRTAAGEERLRARRARHNPPWSPADLDPGSRCIHFSAAGPPMMPAAYNNNYHLVQTADYVLIVNEMVHSTRIIPLDGRAPLNENIRQWLGSSRGHWQGDTLVVETTNLRDDGAFFLGIGAKTRVTERFTRVADDVLLYEFTVDDPEDFTRPWTAQIPSVRVDELMYEYACHEGNRGLHGILAGARAQEAAEQK